MTTVNITLKNGVTTTDPRLDRVPEFDEASREYQVRTLLRELAKRRRSIVPGLTLDQGHEGACTGFSCGHAMASSPHRHKEIDAAKSREWYFEAQRLDQWAGGEYPGASPRYAGSSVLGSMKALAKAGLIREYRWIGAGSQQLDDDLRDTLKYVGPVCLGLNWYDSMFETQPNGLLEVNITQVPAGGHAICAHDVVLKKLAGTDKRREYVVLQNSWGGSWGVPRGRRLGFAYVLLEDLVTLLELDGDGAVPIKPAKETA